MNWKMIPFYFFPIPVPIPEKLLRSQNHDSVGIRIDPPLDQTILCDYPLVHSLADDVAALYGHLQKHLVAPEVPDHPRVLLLLALVRPLVERDDVPLPRGRGAGHAAVDHRLLKSLVQFEPAECGLATTAT